MKKNVLNITWCFLLLPLLSFGQTGQIPDSDTTGL